MSKPLCKYGASCYRKNSEHLKRFSHPGGEQEDVSIPGPDKKRRKLAKPEEKDPLPGNPSSSFQFHRVSSLDTGKEEVLKRVLDVSNPEEVVQKLFLVKLPEDFYAFWDFCEAVEPDSPSSALLSTLGLDLVGPYDALADRLGGVSWEQCVLHSRHYYDPPEMTTVLTREGGRAPGFHIGYFQDDPNSEQFLLVSNDSEHCELEIEGNDIFSAVSRQVQAALQGVGTEGEVEALKALDSKLCEHRAKLKTVVCKSVKDLQKRRSKDIVATTFNKLGIVVPYDEKTELGYRPLPMSNRELLKLLNKICNCSGNEVKQDAAFEPLQEIVTFVQFANDECDYGMGLELGVDLFCHGDAYFHRVLEHVLPLAYELLGRVDYAKICRLHLKQRNRIPLNYIMQ